MPPRWTLRRTLRLLQPTGMVVRRSKLHPSSTFTMRTGAVACKRLERASGAAYLYFHDSRNFNTTIIGNIYLGNLRHLGPVYCNSIAYRAGRRTKETKFPSLRVPRISLRWLAGGIRLSDRILWGVFSPFPFNTWDHALISVRRFMCKVIRTFI